MYAIMWVLSSFCFVVEGGHGLNSSLGILWQACPGGARILRVFGDSPCPALPVQIEGFPVVEIGPYCFADKPIKAGAHRTSLLMPDFGALTAAAPLLTPTPLRGILCRALPCPPGCGRCITLPFITAASWNGCAPVPRWKVWAAICSPTAARLTALS